MDLSSFFEDFTFEESTYFWDNILSANLSPSSSSENIINYSFDPHIVLDFACRHGLSKVVELLMYDKRTNVNQPNNHGATPFYVACQEGFSEIVTLLLKHSELNPNQTASHGVTPFYAACQNGHVNVVQVLLNHLEKKDQHEKLVSGSTNTIDINLATLDGTTPLYIACQNGHLQVVQLLLRNQKVDVNKPRLDGATPLFIACDSGQLAIVQEILISRPYVDLYSPWKGNGHTALDQAKWKGQISIVNIIESFIQKHQNFNYPVFLQNQNQTQTQNQNQYTNYQHSFSPVSLKRSCPFALPIDDSLVDKETKIIKKTRTEFSPF